MIRNSTLLRMNGLFKSHPSAVPLPDAALDGRGGDFADL